MELGLTCLRTNELEEANVWFEKAKRDYSGYLIEMMVHFRVHCGQRVLKHIQRKMLAAEKSLQDTSRTDSGNVSTTGETSSSQSDDGQISIHSTDQSNDESSIGQRPQHSEMSPETNDKLNKSVETSAKTTIRCASLNNVTKRPLTSARQRSDANPHFLKELEQASNQL